MDDDPPAMPGDAADVFARRSIAIARAVVGAFVIAYSLSTGFKGSDVPSYARLIGGLAGGGFLISAVAGLLSRPDDASVRRWLVVFDAVLVAGLLFAFVEAPTSYEYVAVPWVAVEAATVFDVRRTLLLAAALTVVYVASEIVAVNAFGQTTETAGILVRIATFVAIALVTSSYATAMQSKRLLIEERTRSVQLRELDGAKTMFIRAVAHDLRTPLAVVTGMADLIATRSGELSQDQLEQLSRTILKNGRKLESLVGDLMDSQRLSQGVLKLDRKETDLAALIQAAVDDVDMQDHPLECDLAPATASVDAPKVERVVENLLINAVKHTDPGTPVWVGLREESNEVVITVEDAGAGVHDHLKEQIFQPFVQGAEGSPGTGVGLSLVRGITELHGGRAWVEDRDGGGCMFKVVFPKAASG